VIVVAVLVAGSLGAVIRYLVSRWLATPMAVLVVNVVGSAIGGVLLATTSGDLRLVLLTGFCGGLTTFSTFSVETVQLVLDGKSRTAFLSVAANLVLGIGAAAIGYLIAL
jgi:CrcB protein